MRTSGFVQLGLDVEAIIGSAYPSFIFGERNSAGLLFVNFGFYFIRRQFRADVFQIPIHQKAVNVSRINQSQTCKIKSSGFIYY